MANVSFRLARWIVVVLLCLSAPISAFAQGGTGTLTGTVVDGTGAASRRHRQRDRGDHRLRTHGRHRRRRTLPLRGVEPRPLLIKWSSPASNR